MRETYVKVDKNVFHLKTCEGDTASYICAWYIQNISSLKSISSRCFLEKKTGGGFYACPTIYICPDPKGIKIEIRTSHHFTRFDISIASRSGKVPLNHSCKSIHYSNRIYCAFIEGEDFQKLKRLPDNTSVIICRMKLRINCKTVPEPNPTMNSEYISSLKEDLNKYSGTSSKEIVNLRVGEETVSINKAILCIRSPVFAKMFENDVKELKHNTVTITDIKMPVLRVLVSFLYFGLVPDCDCDFDFSCHLYYAADKYDIKDLRLACISLLVSKATLENLFQLLKLSLSHNDELLKSSIMVLININIQAVMQMPDWEILMHEDPELALEAATLFA